MAARLARPDVTIDALVRGTPRASSSVMTTRNNGTTSTGSENLEGRIDSIRDGVKDFVDSGQEKVSAIKDRVIEVKDRAVSTGNEYLDRVTDLIKANPMKAVAIAFGVGYLGMRLFRR